VAYFCVTKIADEKFDIRDTLIFKQNEDLEEEVQRHKWIESEKAGRDVGYDFARIDLAIRRVKKADRDDCDK